MPFEMERSVLVDGLAQRYGCTPSQILNEPVEILRISELALMNEQDKIKKAERKAKR
jgi:hypothetical protein